MEKEPQPDSLSTVTVKEYPASEVYSTSEPPPAYHRSRHATAVQVARIAAVTVVVVSFILGTFMLASAYIQANASCAQLQQELMLLQEAAERFQPPEALVQEEPVAEQSKVSYDQQQPNEVSTEHTEKVTTKSSPAPIEESEEDDNELDSDTDENDSNDNENNATPIHFKLPLQLDFDDIAGALIEKNQRSRMNCIVEKKRADEVIDHQPKTLRLPFGLNLTTDPRYEHVTGEKMAIYCESGNEQRHVPQVQSEEVMMHIQPIIIPIAEQMPVPHPHPQQMPIHFNAVPQQQPPVHPQMMRGNPVVPPHIIAQHIAQIQRIAASQQAAAQQQPRPIPYHPQQPMQHMQHMQHPYQHPVPPQMPPQMPRMVQQPPMQQRIPIQDAYFAQSQRLPIPEEILTQINRLPNEDVIAIQVSEETDEQPTQEQENIESRENRVMQEQPPNVQEINDRQSYARGLPVNIPVPMMQDVQQPAPEQPRPHYVQPRSIRSVDNALLHREKRVKRCSCDCAC